MLLSPRAFAPTAGTTAQSAAVTAPISSLFNLAQAVPPPLNSQQPPSSIQSLPISMPTGQSSQTLQSDPFSLDGSSDTVMGFSPSGPPLRARATDLEAETINSNPSSGLSDVSSIVQYALSIIRMFVDDFSWNVVVSCLMRSHPLFCLKTFIQNKAVEFLQAICMLIFCVAYVLPLILFLDSHFKSHHTDHVGRIHVRVCVCTLLYQNNMTCYEKSGHLPLFSF